jgi:hypothetical protein
MQNEIVYNLKKFKEETCSPNESTVVMQHIMKMESKKSWFMFAGDRGFSVSSRLKTHLVMLWHMETKNRWFEHHCLYYKQIMYITKPSEPLHTIKKGIQR